MNERQVSIYLYTSAKIPVIISSEHFHLLSFNCGYKHLVVLNDGWHNVDGN